MEYHLGIINPVGYETTINYLIKEDVTIIMMVELFSYI